MNTRIVELEQENAVLLSLVIQYRDDLRRPPSGESKERRLEVVNAVLAKFEAKP